jgi:hypothetical protein
VKDTQILKDRKYRFELKEVYCDVGGDQELVTRNELEDSAVYDIVAKKLGKTGGVEELKLHSAIYARKHGRYESSIEIRRKDLEQLVGRSIENPLDIKSYPSPLFFKAAEAYYR